MNNKNFSHKCLGDSTGFSLIELMVVVAIIGILSLMSAPVFVNVLAKHQVRYVARAVASTTQQARLLAANTQKPIRVVVNCADFEADPSIPCTIYIESANYSFNTHGVQETQWVQVTATMNTLDNNINIIGSGAGDGESGKTPANVFWAIFMPSGEVFSNPNPFKLYVAYHVALGTGDNKAKYTAAQKEYNNGNTNIWLVDVDNTSGRTLVNAAPAP